jgi:hypothetical protein
MATRKAVKAVSSPAPLTNDDDLPEAPAPVKMSTTTTGRFDSSRPNIAAHPMPSLEELEVMSSVVTKTIPRTIVLVFPELPLPPGSIMASEMKAGQWYVYPKTGINCRFRKLSAKDTTKFEAELVRGDHGGRNQCLFQELRRTPGSIAVKRVRRGLTSEGTFVIRDNAILPPTCMLLPAPPDPKAHEDDADE